MNLMDLFKEHVENIPNSPAISMSKNDQTLTYFSLDRKVNYFANYLKSKGINKGDGILILVPMSFELYISLLALFKIGAVAIFIDPQSSKEHINACVKKYPLKAFIGIKKAHILRLLNKDIRNIPIHISIGCIPFADNFNTAIKNQKGDFQSELVNESDPALITFTSGSTGNPKAAVRTHNFLLKQYEVLSKNMLFGKNIVDISTLPVFVLANLAAGMHSVIPNVNLLKPSKINGQQIIDDIDKYQANRLGGSPVLVKKIVPFLKDKQKERSSLSHVYMGGGPVYPKDIHSVQDALPFSVVYGLYGSTEAEPIAHMSSVDYEKTRTHMTEMGKGLYVGKVIDDIEIKIIDSDKYSLPIAYLSNIETKYGEIIVSGEHVLKGYLNGEGDLENKINIDGKIWHRTGDAGYFENGELWLLGRYSQKINKNGQFIYPFAVEASLYEKGYSTAVIEYNDAIYLICEKQAVPYDIYSKLKIDNCIVIDKIPRDRRHNSKVDYSILKTLILKELS